MLSSRLVSFVIGPDPDPRLDKALARHVPVAESLSRSRLARLIDTGAVTVNGQVVTDARARPEAGDEIVIRVEAPADVATAPEAIPLRVVHEDEDLIVVDKPAGMVVHPAPGSPSGTLVNALLHHFGGALSGVGGEKRPGIVHRIDKDTSGLLVVAKSDRAHHGLAAQFADHSVERVYLALCHGVPDLGDPRLRGLRGVSAGADGAIRIATRLARHRTDRQRQAVVFEGGRHAVTHLRVEEAFAGAVARVSCVLETGRTHQIRVHMAHIGHGLLGDPVYGGNRRASAAALGPAAEAVGAFPRQALHAATLGFVHPVSGARLAFEAPLPPDLEQLLRVLREAA
jgi:23S rRNA pseudouridine1911/1915/1917 synthase